MAAWSTAIPLCTRRPPPSLPRPCSKEVSPKHTLGHLSVGAEDHPHAHPPQPLWDEGSSQGRCPAPFRCVWCWDEGTGPGTWASGQTGTPTAPPSGSLDGWALLCAGPRSICGRGRLPCTPGSSSWHGRADPFANMPPPGRKLVPYPLLTSRVSGLPADRYWFWKPRCLRGVGREREPGWVRSGVPVAAS